MSMPILSYWALAHYMKWNTKKQTLVHTCVFIHHVRLFLITIRILPSTLLTCPLTAYDAWLDKPLGICIAKNLKLLVCNNFSQKNNNK